MRRFLLGSFLFLLPTISQAKMTYLAQMSCDSRNSNYYEFEVRATLEGVQDKSVPDLYDVKRASYVELLLDGKRIAEWKNVPVVKATGLGITLSSSDIEELFITEEMEMSLGDSYLQIEGKEALELRCEFDWKN